MKPSDLPSSHLAKVPLTQPQRAAWERIRAMVDLEPSIGIQDAADEMNIQISHYYQARAKIEKYLEQNNIPVERDTRGPKKKVDMPIEAVNAAVVIDHKPNNEEQADMVAPNEVLEVEEDAIEELHETTESEDSVTVVVIKGSVSSVSQILADILNRG